MIEPESEASICRALRAAKAFGIPWMVIGDGSNLLFDDGGIDGMVIKIGCKLARFAVAGATVSAESGIWVPRLARLAARNGLAGMEHTIGIPGRLGGLICMNGGSLRQSIGTITREVTFIDSEGRRQRIAGEKCQFGYRTSIFQEQKCIIAACKLQLRPGSWPGLRQAMRRILRDRRTKFPRRLPSCGSVFRSDPETYRRHGPPGRLIENCGLKGKAVGGARVSHLHANFIVNTGQATADDVLALISDIQDAVFSRYGLRLETEVRYAWRNASVTPVDCRPR